MTLAPRHVGSAEPAAHPRTDYKPIGYCPGCGYRTDPGCCPECGREFTPEQLRTLDPALQRRRRILMVVAMAAIAVVAIWIYRATVVDLLEASVPKSVLFELSDGDGSLSTWAGEVLIRRLRADRLSAEEVHRLVHRMLPFSGEPGLQAFHYQPDLEFNINGLMDELWLDFVPQKVVGSELLWLDGFRIMSLRHNGQEIESRMDIKLPARDVVGIGPLSSISGELEIRYEVEVWACPVGPHRPDSPCAVIRDVARFAVVDDPSADPKGWTLKVRLR